MEKKKKMRVYNRTYSQIIIKNIISQQMLTDMSSKQSFTTFNQETRMPCSCGNYDKFLLKERLQQILNCLYDEISSKQKQMQTMVRAHQENSKQKDDIIQRLVSANSKLVVENQALSKKIVKNQIYLKSVVADLENKYQAVIQEMNDGIRYLQEKNMQLKKQIISTLSLIPQELINYQVNNVSAPRNHQIIRQSRYSHISPPSPFSTVYYNNTTPAKHSHRKKMAQNVNMNSMTSLTSLKRLSSGNTKKKSSIIQSDSSQGFLKVHIGRYQNRSKSSFSRQECQVEGA